MKIQTIEPPLELNHKNIVFWSEHYQKLVVEGGEKAMGTKARKFVELGLVRYSPDFKEFIVLPIKGYNHTAYQIKNVNRSFTCECQGFSKKGFCSHTLAVYLYLRIKHYNRNKELNRMQEEQNA